MIQALVSRNLSCRNTPYQAGYWAHWLTLDQPRGGALALAQTMASAKVDLNPHQVEAALFALRSPVSRGVLLADEVGLGKTIEASLVLAQKWAEHRRKLLLIVPASLRKQWSQELAEKFSLPSRILESGNFKEAMDAGVANPFDVERTVGGPAIVISSYEFASRQNEFLAMTPWDLVVFDEAHKLRGIYKPKPSEAKTAKALHEALRGCHKIMLSATPLQNNLQELYGLVSVLDPHFFGGLDAFKARYCRPNLPAVELHALRERLKPIVTRTLRRQVQEEGGIRFTRRFSLTEDFSPSEAELQLYQCVSEYLQDPELLAIKRGARHLVTLVVRKILASSSRAIAGTLDTMIARLERHVAVAQESLADFDSVDDLSDALEGEGDELTDAPAPDPTALQAEIAQLKDFRQLARSIERDCKAEALLRVLDKAFEMTERLGGARKAVVFTESVRTQQWLFELLNAVPSMQGNVILLNGSNSDPGSRQIYKDWCARYEGTARSSGSRTADMKAALVDCFREAGPNSILLCTEAGAEGINLQFCSILVNYDLPWNPQRVEQRIGRVHRYGQKNDVVVVNFINKGNLADRRVFELLNQKFKLFEGVFGASDEILGSIESGVDIQQRILSIYQQCRSDAEIDDQFNALQAELRIELEAKDQQTQRSLLDHFDADVVQKLNLRREQTTKQLDLYQTRLIGLARLLLPTARCEDHRFWFDGRWYDVNWQKAQTEQAEFFRPNEGLGQRLIEQAKRALAEEGCAAELNFWYTGTERGEYSDLRRLMSEVGEVRGELVVEKLTLQTPRERRETLLVVGRTETGEFLKLETCERLLSLPAEVVGPWTMAPPDTGPNSLAQLLAQQEQAERGTAERDNALYYEAETDKLDRWAEDRRVALDIRNKQLDAEIKLARKAIRQLVTLQEKLAAKRALQQLERDRDEAMLAYHEAKKKIEAEEDRLLAEVEAALQLTAKREHLFSIRWHLRETHETIEALA